MDVLAHLIDDGLGASVVVAGDGGMPVIAHLGAALGDAAIDARAFDRPAGGALDHDPPAGIVPEAATGWFGRPGIEGHRSGGRDHAPRFAFLGADVSARRADLHLMDPVASLDLTITIEVCAGGVVRLAAVLTNDGADAYTLDTLRVTVPVPGRATDALTLGGRWANEFQPHRTPWIDHCLVLENRHGRTSHQIVPAAFVGTAGFGEQHGEVWGAHLAWSGNSEITLDAVTEGRKVVQAGELLLSGEVELAPGESYSSPDLLIAWSGTGLTPVSQRFHAYVRALEGHPARPRPIGLNTWEAVYFEHDLSRLTALADVAAEIGIERYVLDDGWFHLRRDDRAGLGDWWCDPDVWPDGLTPLIEHVRGLGMEFGLWFEPEMVNPDSDLYREHPDWALVDHRYPLVLGRHQLVLDLGRAEVRDHLFALIDRMLSENDIAYVKWDHNRDLVSPTSKGRAGVHRQTLGVYELLARVRAAHPDVEIETCASGGGRIDAGILRYTQRAWTSDSIDALDRQSIQRGFSMLFPPEVMGTHIGAPVCHTTRRRHSLGFRIATAFFGSMGVEWNLLDTTPRERGLLRDALAMHKELRPLLHGGDVVRVDHADPSLDVHGVIARDRTEALFAVTRLFDAPTHHTPALCLPGLDPDTRFDVELVTFGEAYRGPVRGHQQWLADRHLSLTGRQLATLGFHPPAMNPESTVMLRVRRETV